MSHGVKKDTFVEADDKTRNALTYDIMDHISKKVDKMADDTVERVAECRSRFKKIENGKTKDAAKAAAGGVGGGFLAVAAYYLKEWLSK